MKITVFGIGSASPAINFNPSSFLVTIGNEHVLIDCGEGTQYRLLEHKIKKNRLKTICISHLHGDHYFGLIGLLSSLNLNHRTEPLLIIGPKGLKEIVELQFFHAKTTLRFKLKFIQTKNNDAHLVLKNEVFNIHSFPLIHRVPSTGFLVSKHEGPRHIIPELLPKKIPLPFIQRLKLGRDVIDPMNGQKFSYKNLTKKGNPALKFAYCSDTAFNPKMIATIANADLLYHEATFTNEHEDRAELTQHSTAEQAAIIAKKAKVKKMLMGHLSSRYKSGDVHLLEAKQIFKNTELAIEGSIYEII